MRPPSQQENSALRQALLREAEALDDPVQALAIHRALSQASIAVLPCLELPPQLGNAPIYLVLWPHTLDVSVFVTSAAGEVMRVKGDRVTQC